MPREIVSKKDANNPEHPANNATDFKDRLAKLMPSEIVVAYTTITGLVITSGVKICEGAEVGKRPQLLIAAAVLFAFTPAYLYFISKVKKAGQIIFTTIAFAIWVCAMGGPFECYQLFATSISSLSSILLIIYTLFIPLVYKG